MGFLETWHLKCNKSKPKRGAIQGKKEHFWSQTDQGLNPGSYSLQVICPELAVCKLFGLRTPLHS